MDPMTILATAVGVAGTVSTLASAFTAAVKPPSATSPAVLQGAYKTVSWVGINLGWSRNAVLPGMPQVVQEAAAISAKIAAAAPHLTEVAEAPAILGSIVNKGL